MKRAALILLGIFLSAALLELGMRTAAYMIVKAKDYRNRARRGDNDRYVILCLGESTTDGQYPKYLEQELNERNLGIKFRVIDKGKGGCMTSYILANLEFNIEKYKPDMIITMMGINDGMSDIIYEDKRNLNVIKRLRVYRLIRLLGLHIRNTTGFGRRNEKKKKEKEKDIDKNLRHLMDLAGMYQEEKKYSEAEQLFKRIVNDYPGFMWGYIGLGYTYDKQDKQKEAAETFGKVFRSVPCDERIYTYINEYYTRKGMGKQLESEYNSLIGLNPDNEYLLFGLGLYYLDLDLIGKVEELFKKIVEINPDFEPIYSILAKYYWGHGLPDKATESFSRMIELSRNNTEEYMSVFDDYQDDVNLKLKKLEGEAIGWYGLAVKHNYNKIKEIVLEQGIKLVCMQYPMISIEPLKKMLEPDNGIIFVDNERLFAEKVDREGIEIYFSDMFAGNFGHCTMKGNKLIAGNIADVLEKEVFKRK